MPPPRQTKALRVSSQSPPCISYSEFIFSKNSALFRVLPKRSTSNSIASTGDNGFSTFLSTQIRCKSSLGISSSSLRVPER